MRLIRGESLLGIAVACLFASTASAISMGEYAVFAAGDLILGDGVSVHGGLVGSNGNIAIRKNTETLLGIHAGGSINPGTDMGTGSTIGNLLTFSEVIVNGSFDYQGKVYGDVHAGGDVQIRYGGQVLQTLSAQGGNIYSGGSVLLRNNTLVEGDVKSVGAVTQMATAVVGGTISQNLGSAPAELKAFNTIAMEPATSFSVGGADILTPRKPSPGGHTTVLAPGSYGDLALGIHNNLYLSAGDYYFTSMDSEHDLQLHLDLSTGSPINIFVAGDARFGDYMDVLVQTPTSAGYIDVDLLSDADKQLASLVYMETLGSWRVQIGGDWFGTAYATGSMTLGFDPKFGIDAQMWGALYSGSTLYVKETGFINYVQSYRFVPESLPINDPISQPEPLTGALALITLGALVGYTSRRRRTA